LNFIGYSNKKTMLQRSLGSVGH